MPGPLRACAPLAEWLASADWRGLKARYGPVAAGGCFGAAWAAFADNLVTRAPGGYGAPQVLPGVAAALAALMLNLVHRDDASDAARDTDAARARRVRLWLLLCYVCAAAAAVGAVVVMVAGVAAERRAEDGVAVILQTMLLLASGLLFYKTRASEADGGDFGVPLVSF
mmetsp:Transcript_6630/g.20049  ORF Transcript_6630/g.20049 Transcript_6630/m.20049 type:complete len:169 (-) Transcript_6630:143-649(-)